MPVPGNNDTILTMLVLEVPGWGRVEIKYLVFDFNGTLATDGKLSPATREQLTKLSEVAEIHVLTADTYGSAHQECAGLNLMINTFPGAHGAEGKANVVQKLGPAQTLCVGNGRSDVLMAEICAISVGIIGPEGANGQLLAKCDIVVTSLDDVFALLTNPQRIVATLRS